MTPAATAMIIAVAAAALAGFLISRPQGPASETPPAPNVPFSTDGYSVADDVASNQVVVFGGDLSLDQTWVWNGRVGSSYIRGRALQGARRPPWHTTRNCTTERPGFVGQGIATMPPTRYGDVGLSQRVVSGCRGTSNAKDPEMLRCCRADRVRCRQHQRRFGIGRKPADDAGLAGGDRPGTRGGIGLLPGFVSCFGVACSQMRDST